MTQAWLLDLGAGYRVAVGGRELVHLLYAPLSHSVPKTPAHARRVLYWQERLLPVLDLAGWLGGERCAANQLLAGIFAYQKKRGEAPLYGALWLAAPPTRMSVEDKQACALPEPALDWRKLAVSCFKHEESSVPILDMPRLFTSVLNNRDY